jgi:hypothetical protein
VLSRCKSRLPVNFTCFVNFIGAFRTPKYAVVEPLADNVNSLLVTALCMNSSNRAFIQDIDGLASDVDCGCSSEMIFWKIHFDVWICWPTVICVQTQGDRFQVDS